jgi:Ser/Thr protein kinase RdoA (MazF antagonist)
VDDLGAAAHAAAVAAEQWGVSDPVLHRVGMNAIFVADDVVLRVGIPSVPAMASIELASYLAQCGLRVPAPVRDDVVTCGELSVTAWERIDTADTAATITAQTAHWAAVGEIVRRVHAIEPADLPPSVPLPHPSVLPWWHFDDLLARAEPALDGLAQAGLQAAIERHRGWERFGAAVVCHGDVHPGNVVMSVNGPVLLDWDLLCAAPPGWDHGPLLTLAERWGGPAGIYDAFAEGYGRSFADDPATVAFAELRLVAATLMRVIASIGDPLARPEAELRLRHWRGDPAAPQWNAQ